MTEIYRYYGGPNFPLNPIPHQIFDDVSASGLSIKRWMYINDEWQLMGHYLGPNVEVGKGDGKNDI